MKVLKHVITDLHKEASLVTRSCFLNTCSEASAQHGPSLSKAQVKLSNTYKEHIVGYLPTLPLH